MHVNPFVPPHEPSVEVLPLGVGDGAAELVDEGRTLEDDGRMLEEVGRTLEDVERMLEDVGRMLEDWATLEDERTLDDAGRDEDVETPLQVPNAGLHPAPHQASPLPQYPN